MTRVHLGNEKETGLRAMPTLNMTTFKKVAVSLGILGIGDAAAMFAIAGGYNVGTVLPGVAGAGLLVWALLTREKALDFSYLRTWNLKTVLFVFCCCGIVSFTAVQALILGHAFASDPPESDWCIVLGAGIRNSRPSKTLQRRIDITADYLVRHPGVRVVVTGGLEANETITEAEGMRRGLVAKGIDPARIYLEEEATSTWENLRYSMEIIFRSGGEPGKSVAVVTSEFHLFRVRLLAARLGIDIYPVSAPTPWYLLPNACLREYFAIIKSFLVDR